MTRTIFTSFAPNTEADDVRLAKQILFSPSKWQRGSARAALEKACSVWLDAKHVLAFESGRTALYAILSSLDLTSNDEILLQAFTCVAVPGPVLWAGGRPVYVDCELENLTMSPEDLTRKITPRSRVLIIQHTLGQSANMTRLLAIAREHHLFVIEDCAHTFGSTLDGKLVGTFGDAAIFSFGRDKALSGIFGGLAVTAREDTGKRLAIFHRSCPLPARAWIIQQLLHPLVSDVVKKTYDFMALGKIILALAKRLRLISKTVYPIEKTGGKPPFAFKQLPNALALLALHQFEKKERLNEHRVHIAKIYQRELNARGATLPIAVPMTIPIYVRFPIRVADPEAARLTAARQKILLGDWYSQPLAPSGVDEQRLNYTRGSCPNAERLTREILNLPTDIHITSEDALRVIACINSYGMSEH